MHGENKQVSTYVQFLRSGDFIVTNSGEVARVSFGGKSEAIIDAVIGSLQPCFFAASPTNDNIERIWAEPKRRSPVSVTCQCSHKSLSRHPTGSRWQPRQGNHNILHSFS